MTESDDNLILHSTKSHGFVENFSSQKRKNFKCCNSKNKIPIIVDSDCAIRVALKIVLLMLQRFEKLRYLKTLVIKGI